MAGSILETFYILFASDSAEVDEGAQNAEKSTDKLEKSLKDVDKSAEKAGSSFGDLAKKAITTLAPFVGLAAMKGAVVNFAASADAAGKLAKELKVDIEALQAWQGAVVRVGGDAEGMSASIQSLNGKLEEMRRGGGGEAAFVFRRLGVSIKDTEGKIKSADKLLFDLSGRFAGLSQQQAMKMGEKLGLDAGTITLLQKGKKGIEELLTRQKELGLLTKKDAEASRQFNNAMTDMGQSFSAVSAVVMRVLLPVFAGIADGMTTASVTVRKHEDLIMGFFIALSAILGVMAIKAGIAFAPFLLGALLILGVAAAFGILYDDVQNFLGGHDSMIGRLSKDYPWIGELVHQVVDALKVLWSIASAVGTLLVESIDNPARAWQNFTAKIGPLIDAFAEKFPELAQAIQDIGTIIKWLFDLAWPIFKKLGAIIWDGIGLILGKVIEYVKDLCGWIGKLLGWAADEIKGEISVNMPKEGSNENDNDPMTAKPSAALDDPVLAPGAPPPPQLSSNVAKGQDALRQASQNNPPPMPGTIPPEVAANLAKGQDALRQASQNNPPPMPGTIPPEVAANLAKGQEALRQTSTPLAAMPTGAAGRARQEINKTTTIQIARVEINTQATDADGISKGIGGALERELRGAVDNCDDGVAA